MEEIENEFLKIWFEDGILISELKRPTHYTLEVAIEVVEMRHLISNDQSQYWCMDGKNFLSINKEATEYVDKYGQYMIHACAAVVTSKFTKVLYNTYIMLKPPKIPFLAFTSREKAIKWLKEMKEKNERNLK